jgi:zinc transport system substrate-binding protein
LRRTLFFGRLKVLFLPVLVCSLLLSAACSGSRGGSAGSSKLVFVVSILPQTYFTGRVGGDRVRTVVLAGPGQNPHNYEPNPRQISDLAEAKAWILSGTEFEIGLRPKVEALFPSLPIIDGVEGVRFRSLEDHDEDDDETGSGSSIDRHTWLGQEPAKIMARHIRDALCQFDAENASVYTENYEALVRDIDDEFARLRRELAPLRGKPVFVYHPSFGYFLDEFGIIQEAVETGGKEPAPRVLGELIVKAKREGAAAIFVQSQFPVEAARTVAAAAGAELIALDPLSPDWLANITLLGETLKRAGVRSGAAGDGPAGEGLR